MLIDTRWRENEDARDRRDIITSSSVDSTSCQLPPYNNNNNSDNSNNRSANMKFLKVTIAALAGVAVAAPTDTQPGYETCQPATYRCDPDTTHPAWNVCNTSGLWEFAGYCPPHTVCKFNEVNLSPYCVPPEFKFSQ
ncbi:hypothetical protein E4U21_007479 [Claviceps maximensis]|nr:hypothetical protein E4U21_007479 [Claviceps maximensis]